jgi:hypothetical protein
MYISLPKDIPPHPLDGTRVRGHWSALNYAIVTVLMHCIIVMSYDVYTIALL